MPFLTINLISTPDSVSLDFKTNPLTILLPNTLFLWTTKWAIWEFLKMSGVPPA